MSCFPPEQANLLVRVKQYPSKRLILEHLFQDVASIQSDIGILIPKSQLVPCT
jgi:hypothetical protein